MPAKNKRHPAARDIQKDLAGHVEANSKAHEWAAKCLELRAVGKHAQAEAAEAKAKSFLRKVLALEAGAVRHNPHGERRAE
jgi:hypothetical protein